ncbi:MAG: glycosyltransferase [Polyangiaceae bacterium]
MSLIAPLAVALATTWTLLGSAAVAVTTRPKALPPASTVPPVSVLKPLCGADPSLEENLASFFEQDHPDFELVFGVERADDPAVAVVSSLMARYPAVRAKLVVHQGPQGYNPKVRNLRGMLPRATHDLVLISDSNVRAPRHYVRELAQIKSSSSEIGLVTNLFAGATDGRATLGGALESVQLSGFVAAGAALPTMLGDAAVIGKSMLFSRRDLEAMGGLARVADVLAEDYVLGKMFERAGLRIEVAPTVLTNVVGPIGVKAFFDRHLRWSMMRNRLRPGIFLVEPLINPLAMLPFALHALGAWALLWVTVLWWIRDVLGGALLRGRAGLGWALVLGPVRDAIILAVWAVTPLKRHVAWRGHRVRVGKGTVLRAAA